MKIKNLSIVLIIFSTPFFMSFTFDNDIIEPSVIEVKIDENMYQGGWDSWKQTSCYKGLDFRVKNKGKNYDGTKTKWGVQFRNRYNDKIYFSYEVYDSQPSTPRAANRTDLRSNDISSGNRDFYMSNANSIYVYVDSVRFNKDGSQGYYGCDK